MIFYLNKNKRWTKTRPIPVKNTKFNFPANINAVFESIKGMYFFIRNDKYCKRRIDDRSKVTIIVNYNKIFIEQNYL